MKLKNTKINYMYRCAGNYKTSGSVVVEGALNKNEIAQLEGIDSFIPEQVDMPALQEGEYDSDLDHPYHEVTSVEIVDEPTDGCDYTAKKLHKLLTSTPKWDESLSEFCNKG